jgi:hypothetical protein
MSRKISAFGPVIPNAFADLSEFGDAVAGTITSGRGGRDGLPMDFPGRNSKLSGK